jgi:hypothetical protein
MEPRVPWITSVQLMTRPTPAREPGFCTATLYNIYFDSDGELGRGKVQPMPARTSNITESSLYRLTDFKTPTVETCSGPPGDFLVVSPERWQEQLSIVRMFAKARQASLSGDTSIALSLDDQLGSGMEAYYRKHPEDTAGLRDDQRVHRIVDPRAALAEFPIDRIHSISEESGFDTSNVAKQARASVGSDARIVEIGAGTTWKAEMAFRDNRVFALHIIRRVPPPF